MVCGNNYARHILVKHFPLDYNRLHITLLTQHQNIATIKGIDLTILDNIRAAKNFYIHRLYQLYGQMTGAPTSGERAIFIYISDNKVKTLWENNVSRQPYVLDEMPGFV